MSNEIKKWKIFPGRNKFCCDGRIIMGPDVTIFYINITLTIGTSLLFMIFDLPYLTTKISLLIPIATAVLLTIVLSSLVKTSFTDPGIIPRASPDEAMYIERQIKQQIGNAPADRPPPRTKEVLIRGQVVKLKYCFTCKIFRPPRASHCSICDNCVEHFDHHCPWVGNCIGRRNYRYFYCFTVSMSFYIVFVFVCTCAHLYYLSENRTLSDAIKDSPSSVLVIVISFFSCWSVFGLAGFHTYLAAKNQTTNEDIKRSFVGKHGAPNSNPYSFGNSCSNYCYVLCGPIPPSLIDSRGYASQPQSTERSLPNCSDMSMVKLPSHSTKFHSLKPSSKQNGLDAYSVICENPKSSNYLAVTRSRALNACPGRAHVTALTPQSSLSNSYCDLMVTASQRNSGRKRDEKNKMSNESPAIYETVDDDRSACNKQSRLSSMMDVSKIDLDLDEIHDISGDSCDKMGEVSLQLMPSCDKMGEVSLQMMPLSASRLQLLQDTTMIESALDLDSLDETNSSLGTTSQAGLIRKSDNYQRR